MGQTDESLVERKRSLFADRGGEGEEGARDRSRSVDIVCLAAVAAREEEEE